jgi:hypothetical protein
MRTIHVSLALAVLAALSTFGHNCLPEAISLAAHARRTGAAGFIDRMYSPRLTGSIPSSAMRSTRRWSPT